MIEGSSVNVHILKMIGYIKKLDQLGFVMDHKLSIDLVLQSLPPSLSQFIMNFNMNQLQATLPRLLGMLTTIEKEPKKDKSSVLMVQSSKPKSKWAKKKNYKKKGASFKALKPTSALKRTKVPAIIVAKKATGGGTVLTILLL
ncbi:uncharacterized protein LOC110653749 [Hevea brasiliensis]|uniref:uncharacterized protein LOC110653749 n=1 Tax=Hevea brasiliensis TaxID=3981 RepID=UPI0025D88BCF|nr:uncharacterized protein LOC110653749 [Hevea brasiliensis]